MRLGILASRWGNARRLLSFDVMTNSAQILEVPHCVPAGPLKARRRGAFRRGIAHSTGVWVGRALHIRTESRPHSFAEMKHSHVV